MASNYAVRGRFSLPITDARLINSGLTHPTKETGFLDENTSFLPTYTLKNPVSGTLCVSPVTINCKYL
ncbi:hypothetical protein OSCI_3520043 [Kamptonema sp. PCC 6506]|nr:hypothetical protein OSCI_3520043 [Kamptonema sp. PCC 6506]